MDDIIGLFTDFERKFLALISDLIARPKKVLSEVMKRERRYASPFRIYSYVVSLCVLLVVILNLTGGGFFETENKRIPHFWENYFKSQADFILTLVPLIGFIEIIAVFSILTFIFFRKPAASFIHHLKFNTYVISLIGIYLVIAVATMNIAGHYFSIAQDDWIFRSVFILVPGLLYLNAFRAFQNRGAWLLFKGIPIVVMSSFIVFRVFFIGNFNDRLHALALYLRYERKDVTPTIASASVALKHAGNSFQELIIESSEYFSGLIKSSGDTSLLLRSNLLGEIEFSKKMLWKKERHDENTSVVGVAEIPGKQDYLFFVERVIPLREPSVEIYKMSDDTTSLLGSVNARSGNKCRVRRDEVFFSMFDESQNKPYLMSVNDSSGDKRLHALNGLDKWNIGDFHFRDSTDSVLLLVHQENSHKSLSHVALVRGILNDTAFHHLSTTHFYDNPYSDRENRKFHHTVKSGISGERLYAGADDRTYVATFRIFTDRSFALRVVSFDDRSSTQRWTRDLDLPYDIVYFDDVAVKDDKIVIAGRAYQMIPSSVFDSPYFRPFVIVLNEATGETEDFAVLEQSYPIESLEASLSNHPFKVFVNGRTVVLFHYFNNELHRTEVSFGRTKQSSIDASTYLK